MADNLANHTGQNVARPEVPTGRQCLAVIDQAFPTPVPDGRIGVLADLAATAVHEHGTAEIVGVPGNQMNALRSATRSGRCDNASGSPRARSHKMDSL